MKPLRTHFSTENLAEALGYGKALTDILTHINQATDNGYYKHIPALDLVQRIQDTNKLLTALLQKAEKELQAEKKSIESQLKK